VARVTFHEAARLFLAMDERKLRGGSDMVDQVTMRSTVKAVEAAQQRLYAVRRYLETAKQQLHDRGDWNAVAPVIFEAECACAGAQGSLEAVLGWFPAQPEEHKP
jgi:hypothetical protein